MARLSIRKVDYQGNRYYFTSPSLADGINILEGDNGTGKSTFSNLIYYGLGGRVESFRRDSKAKHLEITSDTDNFVELTIEIDAIQFRLKRYIDSNDIGIIYVAGGEVEVLPVGRTQNTPHIFSDWLLDRLGIEAVSIHLNYGDYSGKLGFTDIARLIYHNQSPDPSGIYKPPDTSSFVTDSKIFRKAIFEILVGKSFQRLYHCMAELKDLDKERAGAVNALEFFKRFVDQVRPDQDDLNQVHLDRRLREVQEQLSRAIAYRQSLAKAPRRNTSLDTTSRKNDLLQIEMRSADLVRSENDVLTEISRLQRLKAELILEVTQLKKMMFAHDKLNMFSLNTCPYCLKEVQREINRCVCGAVVSEAQYERFFYSPDEYLTILKSKQRNVDTIDAAIESCREEIGGFGKELAKLKGAGQRIRSEIAEGVEQTDSVIDLTQFNTIDQQVTSLRGTLASLEQQQELEGKREELERKARDTQQRWEAKQTEYNQLQAQADAEMETQRARFSQQYEELMRQTLQDCRLAYIDSDYVPIFDAGKYREASSEVPKRLNYYLTLLYLSLADADIDFPRFLLIDTPETAGIDPTNLINCLSQLSNIVGTDASPECQIILTTGIGKYPPNLRSRVFQTLTKDDRLLKLRDTLPLKN